MSTKIAVYYLSLISKIIILILFFASVPLKGQDVSLNEIMSSNATTINDDHGDSEDWIELYNYGKEPVNLNGYGLSDDYGNPFRWVFPDIIIQPGECLLVWASGKDIVDPGSPLHTNFSIKWEGEEVLLTHPSGTIVDNISPTIIPTDISYGRKPDGTGDWFYFHEPTPGGKNTTTGYHKLLDPPEFSHNGGFYEADFELELSTTDDSAKILYTLDGSEPSLDNLYDEGNSYKVNYFLPGEWNDSRDSLRQNKTYIYNGSIDIVDKSDKENDLSKIITTFHNAPQNYMWNQPSGKVFKGNVIRARVYKDGNISPVATHSYFVNPLAEERYPVPVLSLTTGTNNVFGFYKGIYVPGINYYQYGGTVTNYISNRGNYTKRGREWERPVHMEIFEPDGNRSFSQNLGLRIHGGFSRNYPLKGLRLYARNQYDDKSFMNYEFIPDAVNHSTGHTVNKYKRLVFHDYHQRDMVAIKLMQPGNVGTQGCSPVVHFINGEFWGVTYAKARFDRYHVAFNYGVDPENVIMLDEPSGEGNENDVYEGYPDDILLFKNMFNYAINNDLKNSDNYEYFKSLLDIESFVDYKIMFIYLNNRDWFGAKHFRYWRTRDPSYEDYDDGKWRLLIWDFDMAINHYLADFDMLLNAIHPTGGGNSPYTFAMAERTALLRNLLENDTFRNYFINRFADHINTTFHPDRVKEIVYNEYKKIETVLDEHYDRWHYPAANTETSDDIIAFGEERPYHQREHIKTNFNIDGLINVDLDVSHPGHGHVRINTIDITSKTPGVYGSAYPWSGVYFQGIPVELEAIPAPGYKFKGWEGMPGTNDNPALLYPANDQISITANFEPINDIAVIHYWHFNDLYEGNLSDIPTNHLLLEDANISYPGTGYGYMDRVNDGTELNTEHGVECGYALRVRNPSDSRNLHLSLPTTGYKNIRLSYAAKRTANGATMQEVYYRTNPDEGWFRYGYDKVFKINPEYQLYTLDFAGTDADDNPDFEIKILFQGESTSGTAGNNRFDNIKLEGISTKSSVKPPNSNNKPFYSEKKDPLVYYNQGNLYIENNSSKFLDAMVYDLGGNLLRNININNPGLNSFDINLNPGIYIVRIIMDSRFSTQKVVVF